MIISIVTSRIGRFESFCLHYRVNGYNIDVLYFLYIAATVSPQANPHYILHLMKVGYMLDTKQGPSLYSSSRIMLPKIRIIIIYKEINKTSRILLGMLE